jgi:hypothetical protein
MSWLSIAAGLIRDAMSSSNEPAEPVQDAPPPANIPEVMNLLNRHRSEIDRNFEAVIAMLNAENDRHQKAMQAQRRWNYGLAAALAIVTILAIIAYLQH